MKKFINTISARSLILGISGIAALMIGLILYGITTVMVDGQLSQQMARRWSDKKDVAQISCFFSSNAYVNTDSIEKACIIS